MHDTYRLLLLLLLLLRLFNWKAGCAGTSSGTTSRVNVSEERLRL
jgi:hypothetical protein